MKKTLRSLFVLALAAAPAFSAFADDAKRVIVVTVTTGFRHGSIPFAEKTLQKLADESKAFTIVDFVRQPDVQVPRPPNKPRDLAADASDKDKARHDADMKKYEAELEKWTPEVQNEAKEKQEQFNAEAKRNLEKLSPTNLAAEHIDGVIFANTTGSLPLPDRDGFIQWIKDGHGFVAMHSGSDTFHDFPGYIEMLGGEFQTHKFQVPADLVAADTESPANAGLGSAWNIKQEEVYFIKNQDRSKVHSVWFLRHNPNDPAEAGFFPISWTKAAGKGRVFYTSLGHREDLWSDDPALPGRVNSPEISKQYQAHILGGIKWAIGLVPGSDEPNPEVK
jgi:type 1 glutamine amidotransferase